MQACLQLQVVVIRQGEAGIGQLAAHNGGAPVAPFSRNMISGSRIRRFVTMELEPVTSDGRHPQFPATSRDPPPIIRRLSPPTTPAPPHVTGAPPHRRPSSMITFPAARGCSKAGTRDGSFPGRRRGLPSATPSSSRARRREVDEGIQGW